ncbi:cytochrome c [Roseimicrobium gellanilyticum]|uniref:Cytochrome c n=2 Tax=Roseimicrobium gellanilyticum TaxID=748857 RepID=A0A366HTM2_9BACT|nr:cytochrome c [Roseimicrobium gellanilyticum]
MRFARASFLYAFFIISLAAGGVEVCAASPAKVQFNRDVRPILSDKCFHCHGFDSKKREAGLRLDVREDAIKDKAITPGDPLKSEALVRILSTDPDEHMPPAKSKLGSLTPAEVDILKKWIEQGAEYEAHWAFIPVQKPELGMPGAGSVSPIDDIVGSGLAERGIKPQKEATAETLIRRVSFDLTGLPPSSAEVLAFKKAYAAEPDKAYAALVDRLLASPQFGERMAVDWLDVSRYSDSFGFQVDRDRDVWMWRDWVISAFNRNLPFDQFATWQIAGDLLPDATDEQILATAFSRLHQQESEGGSVEEEYRVEYVADRVQTFATAFLGLTFECARCHDHKFDPISVQDYYGLFSLFQNIDEAGLYSFFTSSAPTPALSLVDEAGKKKLGELKARVDDLEKRTAALRESRRNAFEAWLQTDAANTHAGSVPGELGRYRFETLGKKNTLANDLKADQPAKLKGENMLVPGHAGQALLFTGDDAVDLPIGNFQRQEPFSISLWMQTPDVKDRAVVFHRSRAWTDAASRGYELLIEEGRLKWSLIHFWPGNAISVRAREPLPVKQWTHVTVSYDGSSRADGLKLYVNGKHAAVDVIRDSLTREITGGGGDNIALAERFRDKGFKGGMLDDFRVFGREVGAGEAALLYADKEGGAAAEQVSDKRLLQERFFATADEEWKSHLENLKVARAELYKAQDAAKEIMVMRELPEPKTAYILFRGEYNQRREVVPPSTPSAVPPFSKQPPKNRLDLAKWLTSPENPLFARVTVNRIWQSLFGRGLVKTSEDFGSQSERPLYPELLDWLAWHFRESGWDVKHLMKTIVMSRTYRQDSFGGAQVMADDPDNAWLARGPRFRLPAEMIRDNALAASGLLRPRTGGPPVRPYEMTEAFKPMKADAGDDAYRRSLYTIWRRTSPPPAMVAFDAPRRAVCIAKRERTDSPLQALILLNGTQYVEAARVLGEKLHREAKGDVKQMIIQGFLTCLSREPDAKEMDILQQLHAEQLAHFKQHPAEADALLKQGSAKRDASLPAPEAAAATVLVQALMNHDACVVKR